MNTPTYMLVVVDASVVIALAAVGQFEVLRSLFGTVVVPEAVYTEVCGAQGRGRAGDAELQRALCEGWVALVQTPKRIAPPYSGMRAGEVEVISVAVDAQDSKVLVLMDERIGRRRARQEGLQVLGTLGVLKLAKARGLLESVEAVMNALTEQSFRIAATLRQSILAQVGETTDF